MSSKPFNALIFDLGSTLIFFSGEWPQALRQADAELMAHLRASGTEFDEQALLDEFHKRMDAYYVERDTEFIEYTTHYLLKNLLIEYNFAGGPDELARAALYAMYAVTQAYWQVEAETQAVLDSLKEKGYRLALISNAADDADVQTLVDKAGIRPYFEIIRTSAAAGIRKPNPRIFRDVLQELGVEPGRAAMVGDSLGADVLGAKNAGMFSIWLTRRVDTAANRAHLDTIRPDAIISSLQELPDLLDRLEGRG